MMDSDTLDKSAQNSPASVPAAARRLALFSSPPLLDGEDGVAYDELLSRISAEVRPADIIEDIWVHDIVDLVWEAVRLRRLKSHLMMASVPRSLETVLKSLVLEYPTPATREFYAKNAVKMWLLREADGIKLVNEILSRGNLTMDAVMAQCLSQNIETIERIERMTAMAQRRRDLILDEIDRHRVTIARALRRSVQHIEDGECQVVESESTPEGGGP
jgi:hypothetical protein